MRIEDIKIESQEERNMPLICCGVGAIHLAPWLLDLLAPFDGALQGQQTQVRPTRLLSPQNLMP